MVAGGDVADPTLVVPQLPELTVGLGPFELQPRCFMVAWSGVLALAYDGWPEEVELLKARLGEKLPLKPENPGSVWPKTSLAVLRHDKTLTPEDLRTLRSLCEAATQTCKASQCPCVPVQALHVSTYACRSHERLLCTAPVQLRGPSAGPASRGSQEYTDRVIADYAADDYWQHASRDGSREPHYRDGVIGSSLVAFLGGSVPAGISQLRQQVEEALPGYYAWFSDESLHCTVRGLA